MQDSLSKQQLRERHAAHGPWGEESHHLETAELERRIAGLQPPRDRGEVALLVSRADDGERTLHERMTLTVAGGMPGDAWLRDTPELFEAQLAVMRSRS